MIEVNWLGEVFIVFGGIWFAGVVVATFFLWLASRDYETRRKLFSEPKGFWDEVWTKTNEWFYFPLTFVALLVRWSDKLYERHLKEEAEYRQSVKDAFEKSKGGEL